MGERMLFPPQMIRDLLRSRSIEPFYDENGGELWEFFKRLFTLMNTGGTLSRLTLPQINGGLFEPDPFIDGLSVPNHVFAKAGQGANEASLESDRETLFYLCARYNYAARGDVKESLSLYTLGHIFEQSIIELEYREGELENRETIAKLSKRKRDGVYYTPESVVNYLVEQSLEAWFADTKASCGYPRPDEGTPTATAAAVYVDRLKSIRIVDPACGSGAFLISALRRILAERIAASCATTSTALTSTRHRSKSRNWHFGCILREPLRHYRHWSARSESATVWWVTIFGRGGREPLTRRSASEVSTGAQPSRKSGPTATKAASISSLAIRLT
jgi:hypothetical protein